MKVGDLVRYRDRIPTDPHPRDIYGGGAWGSFGIVISVFEAEWGTTGVLIPSLEYVDFDGDWVICKQEDVEVINEMDS